MKPTILQCLQQFCSKNSKNVYHDQFLKKLKLQCQCKIFAQFCTGTVILTFLKIGHDSKNSKNVYHDQFLKKLKLQCQCKIVQNLRFSL